MENIKVDKIIWREPVSPTEEKVFAVEIEGNEITLRPQGWTSLIFSYESYPATIYVEHDNRNEDDREERKGQPRITVSILVNRDSVLDITDPKMVEEIRKKLKKFFKKVYGENQEE